MLLAQVKIWVYIHRVLSGFSIRFLLFLKCPKAVKYFTVVVMNGVVKLV